MSGGSRSMYLFIRRVIKQIVVNNTGISRLSSTYKIVFNILYNKTN